MNCKRFGVLALAALCAPAAVAKPKVVACGAVLDSPGNYQLSEDLSCPLGFPPPLHCDTAAITITAPKVRLNGRGFTVSGNQTGVGIHIMATDAHVHNIAVEAFKIGIQVMGGGSHHLNHLEVHHSSDFHCGDGGVGLQMVDTFGNRLHGSHITQNERWGVRMLASDHNRFNGNEIAFNRFRPGAHSGNFDLSSSHDNRIIGNDLSGGGVFGVLLEASHGNLIAANVLEETGTQAGFGTAISLTGSEENTLQANWVDREPPPGPTVGFIGIHLFEGASRNRVLDNTVLDHTASGIVVVVGATENLLQGNEAFDNTPWDARDDNPDCDANIWQANQLGTVNQPACIQ